MKNATKASLMSKERKALSQLHESPHLHIKRGEQKAFALFLSAATNVPAYKAFLKKHKISAARTKTIRDFDKLPVMDKSNYLRLAPYRDLFSKREFSATTISATSGSTGEPFYFPRTWKSDDDYQRFSESFLYDQFDIDHKKTLAIVGFGMGMWIAGISTYTYLYNLARQGLPLTVMPIGFNIETILSSVKNFGHYYDQIILTGYPPLIKDILDRGKSEGIDWKKYSLKIITSGEGFTEPYRDYIAELAGVKKVSRDIVGLYGSTELGGMGHETTLSVLIRRLAYKNKELREALFGSTNILPSFVQYHPDIVYFEAKNGELLATGSGSSIPLIRYRFPDRGGVLSYEKTATILKKFNIDMHTLLKSEGYLEKHMKLPFLYVSERSDGAISVVGANIFPQQIKEALYDPRIKQHITGKFHITTKEKKGATQQFVIYIEMRLNIKKSSELTRTIQMIISKHLKMKSAEYAHILEHKKKEALPTIVLTPYHEAPYFEIGKKHRWLKKLPS